MFLSSSSSREKTPEEVLIGSGCIKCPSQEPSITVVRGQGLVLEEEMEKRVPDGHAQSYVLILVISVTKK